MMMSMCLIRVDVVGGGSVSSQLMDIISNGSAGNHSFVSVEECVWGPQFLKHPSYARMNRLCAAKWAAHVPGTCPVSEWSVWSPCEAACGDATRYTLTALALDGSPRVSVSPERDV